MRIQYDIHIHTEFSLDSETPITDQIRRAKQLHLSGIGISDHIDYGFPVEECPLVEENPFTLDVESYLKTINREKEKESELTILTGIECGLQSDREIVDFNRKLFEDKWLDYVIGSIHLIDKKDPYNPSFWSGRNSAELLKRYFEITLENISCFDGFDTLGHLDYAVRYAPDRAGYTPSDYFEITDEIMKILIKKNKALEINTSSLKKGFGFTNPHIVLIQRYYELGGRLITIGSDAHEPSSLAYAFDETAEQLLQIGFKTYTVFKKHIPNQMPL